MHDDYRRPPWAEDLERLERSVDARFTDVRSDITGLRDSIDANTRWTITTLAGITVTLVGGILGFLALHHP